LESSNWPHNDASLTGLSAAFGAKVLIRGFEKLGKRLVGTVGTSLRNAWQENFSSSQSDFTFSAYM